MIDPAADELMRSNPEYATVKVEHRDLGDGVCVVAVHGEVDLASAPGLKSALAELLTCGFSRYVIDIAGVRHLDSTGLGVLVGFRRRVGDDGIVTIASPRANVLALFELTGLDQSFDIFGTQEEATAHIKPVAAPALSPAAAMAIGLVSTALPFADSPISEAERWLRVLRLHGEAGRALTTLGLSEAPVDDVTLVAPVSFDQPVGANDPIAAVTAQAKRIAAERGSAAVGTGEILLGVMAVYGPAFDSVLRAHGTDRDEVMVHLGGTSGLIAA
jgi:anti-sigma B factor antagonist